MGALGALGTDCTDELTIEDEHAGAIGNLGSMGTARPIIKTKSNQTNSCQT